MDNLVEIIKRKETLVHPMEMNHISLLELVKASDVSTRISHINLKQVLAAEPIVKEDSKSLIHKLDWQHHTWAKCHHKKSVSLLVTYQHLGSHTIVF
jgi:hypothetical protein